MSKRTYPFLEVFPRRIHTQDDVQPKDSFSPSQATSNSFSVSDHFFFFFDAVEVITSQCHQYYCHCNNNYQITQQLLLLTFIILVIKMISSRYICLVLNLLASMVLLTSSFQPSSNMNLSQRRQIWIERSVDYYSKVMREERRRNMGQVAEEEFGSEEYQTEFLALAKKHYFALRKIKDGKHVHAEIIYRRIIDEIMNEEEDGHCDHAKLAVTTLLLALHCQRMGDLKKARSVFLNFFRVVVAKKSENEHLECACSAKVLGAYALFEMKRGNACKSLEIARKAVEFDQMMEPVLSWKQFRDAERRMANRS